MDNPYSYEDHCLIRANAYIHELEAKYAELVRSVSNADRHLARYEQELRGAGQKAMAQLITAVREACKALTTEAPATIPLKDAIRAASGVVPHSKPSRSVHVTFEHKTIEAQDPHHDHKHGLREPKTYVDTTKASTDERPMFPEQSEVCQKCKTKAVVIMDGIETCLKCGYSVQPADDREGES